MSQAEEPRVDREIARTLATVVTEAIEASAPADAIESARDAAQLLNLPGLDRALAALMPHAGRHRPAELEAVMDRVARVAARCAEAGDLGVFREADTDLNALAAEVSGYEWSEPITDAAASVATLPVSQVFEDTVLADEESLLAARRLRLSVPVAAALRAAIDWLTPEDSTVHPLRLHGEPSMLEVRLDQTTDRRLVAVHRVVSAVNGNLGPALDGRGWIIRVPAFAVRAAFLMVEQAGIRIAMPWHSVLKLHMVPAAQIEQGMEALGHPVLPTFGPPEVPAPTVPVVLVGHGLKRAYVVADRLIWRLLADACDAPGPSPAPSLHEAVSTDEDDVHWVLDAGRYLESVEMPTPAAATPPPVIPVLTDADVEPLREPPIEAPAPAPPTPIIADVPVAPALAPAPIVAEAPVAPAPEPEVVAVPAVPLPAVPLPAVTIDAAPAPPPVAPAPAPAPVTALVAADSITARVFLTRLLALEGITAESVSSGADLLRRIHEQPWSIVFTDVDMHDARGPAWLGAVREAALKLQPVARVVALVRDRADLDVARSSGVSDTLLKPFGRETLGAVLGRIGHGKGTP